MAKRYKYNEFGQVFSSERMRKYRVATGNNTHTAMTLYRYNLGCPKKCLPLSATLK